MIHTGTVLVQDSAARPEIFHPSEENCPASWTSIEHGLTQRELETELSNTGWTFFFMASPVRAIAFGRNAASRMAAALKRLVASVREEGCNSLVIDEVAPHVFLGIPYLSISAHARHIQKGRVFVAQ